MYRNFAPLLFFLAVPIQAQHEHHDPSHHASPYSADTARAVKALAPSEVQGLLEGHGLGLARAAELNRYPGPKHVLELGDALSLSAAQRERAEALRQEVQRDARRLGAQIVAEEEALDALFADGNATLDEIDERTASIATLRGQLRAVHLRAHVAMREALTDEQVATYDRLRGYTD